MGKEKYGLHSAFDLELHKENFIDYLEVIILVDGTVVYAVPCHIEKLCEIYGKSKEEIQNEMSIYDSPINYMLDRTKCVAVWSVGYMTKWINSKQQETLDLLVENKLTVNRLM